MYVLPIFLSVGVSCYLKIALCMKRGVVTNVLRYSAIITNVSPCVND